MWRAAVLLLGMLGCASSPSGPFFHDDHYLRFGVDPDAEANAVIESQKERDYRLARRMDGRHFAALGFMDKGGRSRAVRILTVRGIAVALDSRPESPIQPAANYALISSPLAETYDADGDGFEEVFVEERTPNEACLRVFRVRDVGFVDPVVIDSLVLGQEICPHAAIDLDGDGVVELTTELDLVGFPGTGAIVPRMQLPLWADHHRFVARSGSAAQRAWLGRERARLDVELQRARQRLDVSRCYFLGIELAALAYLERSDPANQLAAFDRALGGLVLTPPQAAANLRARSHIYTDWNDPKRLAARSAIAALPPKETREPAARQLNASKTAPASDPAASQRVRRVAAGAQLQPSAPLATPVDPDEPVLAEGEFVITPESAAQDAKRRAARARTDGSTRITQRTAPPSEVDASARGRQRTAPLSAANGGEAAVQSAPLRMANAEAAVQRAPLRAAKAGGVASRSAPLRMANGGEAAVQSAPLRMANAEAAVQSAPLRAAKAGGVASRSAPSSAANAEAAVQSAPLRAAKAGGVASRSAPSSAANGGEAAVQSAPLRAAKAGGVASRSAPSSAANGGEAAVQGAPLRAAKAGGVASRSAPLSAANGGEAAIQGAPLSAANGGEAASRSVSLRAAPSGEVATSQRAPSRTAAADKVATPQSVSLPPAGAGTVSPPPQSAPLPPARADKLASSRSAPLSAASPSTATTPPTAPITGADDFAAFRAAARELGNAAVAERALAATAREAAAAERREAQAARVRATQAGDPAIAAEHRKAVAEHIAAAQRYAEESNEHAAAAAQHRAALAEHKARLSPVQSDAGEGVAAPTMQEQTKH